ncbi:unnamed protein product [Malus baccata var. baccata]
MGKFAKNSKICLFCDPSRNDIIQNENIRGKDGVAAIEVKMRESWLRWFGHVKRRPTDIPVKKCNYEIEAQDKRGKRKPSNTWRG